MATGRSDYPNQVNNVLGFPFIFRGALDVRASDINEEMKVAATHALASLAKQDVPDSVCAAYGVSHLEFGREYIIPKPFDPRVLYEVASAVAEAAMDSGVARVRIKDLEEYRTQLKERLDPSQTLMHRIFQIARLKPKRIVFSDGETTRAIRACHLVHQMGIARPVLLGNPERILETMERMDIPAEGLEVLDPSVDPRLAEYIHCYHELRFRRGVARSRAEHLLTTSPIHFALMMVHKGNADGAVLGLKAPYPDVIRPALQIIGLDSAAKRLLGMTMITDKRGRPLFFADCLVNRDPTADELAYIAIQAADAVRACDIEPRVAMLSFSNFGSFAFESANKIRQAVAIVREIRPDIVIDGEMQPQLALNSSYREEHYPFSTLRGDANVLILPNLDAASISTRLVTELTDSSLVGPILVGLGKPIAALPQGCSVDEIVNLTSFVAIRGGVDLTQG